MNRSHQAREPGVVQQRHGRRDENEEHQGLGIDDKHSEKGLSARASGKWLAYGGHFDAEFGAVLRVDAARAAHLHARTKSTKASRMARKLRLANLLVQIESVQTLAAEQALIAARCVALLHTPKAQHN
jgi:hypothetical protein